MSRQRRRQLDELPARQALQQPDSRCPVAELLCAADTHQNTSHRSGGPRHSSPQSISARHVPSQIGVVSTAHAGLNSSLFPGEQVLARAVPKIADEAAGGTASQPKTGDRAFPSAQ